MFLTKHPFLSKPQNELANHESVKKSHNNIGLPRYGGGGQEGIFSKRPHCPWGRYKSTFWEVWGPKPPKSRDLAYIF